MSLVQLQSITVNTVDEYKTVGKKNRTVSMASGIDHVTEVTVNLDGTYTVTTGIDKSLVASGQYVQTMASKETWARLEHLARQEAHAVVEARALDFIDQLTDSPAGKAAAQQVNQFFKIT